MTFNMEKLMKFARSYGSRKKLAEAVGIAEKSLNRYYNGERSMPQETLFAIITELGINKRDFMQYLEN